MRHLLLILAILITNVFNAQTTVLHLYWTDSLYTHDIKHDGVEIIGCDLWDGDVTKVIIDGQEYYKYNGRVLTRIRVWNESSYVRIDGAIVDSCESLPTQAYTSNTTAGNQSYKGELGMDFTVTSPISVNQIGAFDDGGNGITGTQTGGVRVAIFYKSSHTLVNGLDAIISGNADTYTGNYRMKNIAPVVLPAGDYVIVAKGYHAGEKNGNSFEGGGPYPAGNGNGVLTFGTNAYWGADNENGFSFPSSGGNVSTSHVYLAGTFSFTKKVLCDTVPVGEPKELTVYSADGVFILRKIIYTTDMVSELRNAGLTSGIYYTKLDVLEKVIVP